KVVDRYASNDKEWIRKMGGHAIDNLEEAVRSSPGSTIDSRKDFMVHVLVHTMNHRMWKLRDHAWLDEGLAYYYSLKVMETCLTHCLDKKESKYAKNTVEGG